MKLTDKKSALVDKLIAFAREKNYHDETIEILIMLCYSKNIKAKGISSDEAIEKMVEYVQASSNSQECLDKALNLAGIE